MQRVKILHKNEERSIETILVSHTHTHTHTFVDDAKLHRKIRNHKDCEVQQNYINKI